ncbi:hypothetical protein NDU88_004725, partial [Pleurodeles waltl]
GGCNQAFGEIMCCGKPFARGEKGRGHSCTDISDRRNKTMIVHAKPMGEAAP